MSDGCCSDSHVLTLYSWPRVPLLMGFVVPGTGVLHCSHGGRSAFCSFFLLSSIGCIDTWYKTSLEIF